MKAHHSSVVGAEWSHWVGQNLLERQQDLMVQTAHQITMSPTERHKNEGEGVVYSPGKETTNIHI